MEVLSSSSYPSGISGDSLREAFASLDAASLERREYSLVSLDSLSSILRGPAAGQQVRPYSASQQHSPTLLKARRRQDGDDHSTACRPLCGGSTLHEMEEEVRRRAAVDRSHRRGRPTQSRPIASEAAVSISSHHINNAGPSFRAFAMSMAEDDSLAAAEGEASVEEAHLGNSNDSARGDSEAPSPPVPSTEAPFVPSEASSSQVTKKRTMQWAARRDKRIARRRDGPPLTRSQARQKSSQIEVAGIGEPEISRPSTASHDITAEITDSSVGENDAPEMVEVMVTPPAKKQKRKKKDAAPALPLTYTEPEIAVEAPLRRESGDSSLTQSDHSQLATIQVDSNEGRISSRYGLSGPAPLSNVEVDSSDTEEEDDALPMRQPQEKRRAKRLPDLEKRQEAPRKRAKTKESVKASKTARVAKPKVASNKTPKGSTIFEGLTFLLFGFWSQVKLFEKLIEKHGGIVCKAELYPEIQSADKIDYILSCTHSGHKPSPTEIARWKVQLAGPQAEHLSDVTLLFNRVPMIQADWISECIAKCLRKEELLSVERHRVGIA